MIFLAMVPNYLKEAGRDSNQIVFAMEQPASPKEYMPETGALKRRAAEVSEKRMDAETKRSFDQVTVEAV